MNSKLWILLILPVLALIWSCAAFQYRAPYAWFSHEEHEQAVVEQRMDCFTCHRVDIAEPDMMKRTEMLKVMLKESDDKRFISGTCHLCHVDRSTRLAQAPARCNLCHDSLKHIIPDDHKGLWVYEHAGPARTAGYKGVYNNTGVVLPLEISQPGGSDTFYSCDSCHQPWFCVNCHNLRDAGQANMHTRTFKIAHVAAAVADPASCSSCHTAKYCRDCHTR